MNTKKSKLIQQLINGILVVVIVGLLGWLSTQYKSDFDWTYGHQNTLTKASQRLLRTLPYPIHFYAFVYGNASGEQRVIQREVERYKRFKHNVTLKFIDPSIAPQLVHKYDVTQANEVVISYHGHHQALTQVTEPKVSEALEQLASKNNTHVTFLSGDGERSITQSDRNGYSSFAELLRSKGMHVSELNLAVHPKIPADTSVLVIADPTSALLPSERHIIERYVQRGGNLLWLADTDSSPHPVTLQKQLGVHWQKGYAVFPNYQELGTGNPGIYLAANYPENPITKNLNEITVFPFVRSIQTRKDSGWNQKPFLQTSASAWLETSGKTSGTIRFNAKRDIRGPLTIGLSETRSIRHKHPSRMPKGLSTTVEKKSKNTRKSSSPGKSGSKQAATAIKRHPIQQRVVMIGDSDFLSNGDIGVLGNGNLGVDVVNWLAERNPALSITIPDAPDHDLYLPGWASWLITAGFVVVLPLLLIGFGVIRWAIRRRH